MVVCLPFLLAYLTIKRDENTINGVTILGRAIQKKFSLIYLSSYWAEMDLTLNNSQIKHKRPVSWKTSFNFHTTIA